MKAINPNISPEAAELLARLQAESGREVWIGQHDYLSSGRRYYDGMAERFGKPPMIYGSDFSFCYKGEKPERIHHCGPANLNEPGEGIGRWPHSPEKVFSVEVAPRFREIDLHAERLALVQRCIELHREGAVVTLMWHGPTPDLGDWSGDGDVWSHGGFPARLWAELLEPGSRLHRAWEEQVDRIAGYLGLLSAAGVPILWRPYHEMNGGWFWWGGRRGPDGYVALWRMLYRRFTEVHGLNNLLWIWNPNAPRDTPGDEAGPYEDYFPGRDWVDVLAADVYHADYRESHYSGLLALAGGKPIALGEVGHLPSPEILKAQPKWSWIMPWGGLVDRFNPDSAIAAFYQGGSPRAVLTHPLGG